MNLINYNIYNIKKVYGKRNHFVFRIIACIVKLFVKAKEYALSNF